jgi:hypothetical protein
MVAELAEDGFKTVVIIDPGIKSTKIFRLQRALEKIILQRADGPWKGFGQENVTFQTIPIQQYENGGQD